MIPERWQQVKAVLEQALDLAPEQRKGFLDDACRDVQALRQEVDSLLQEENEEADGPLQSPVNVSLKDVAREAECWAGRRIGSYEIIELIGEGGMGSLFRAARADEQYKNCLLYTSPSPRD